MKPDDPSDMKGDWNRRAVDNAAYYIATTNWESEEKFDDSGRRDAEMFFEQDQDLLTAEATVLDIGCGIGRMDRHVASRVGRLIGVDVSGEMVARARARLAEFDNVEFVEVDGRSLAPVADASVDVVFSHIVFQHVPRDPVRRMWHEAFRVLRPGGRFLFQVPEAVGESPPDPPDEDTFEMRFWREAAVRAELEAIGFVWESCRRYRVDSPTTPFDHLRPRLRKP